MAEAQGDDKLWSIFDINITSCSQAITDLVCSQIFVNCDADCQILKPCSSACTRVLYDCQFDKVIQLMETHFVGKEIFDRLLHNMLGGEDTSQGVLLGGFFFNSSRSMTTCDPSQVSGAEGACSDPYYVVGYDGNCSKIARADYKFAQEQSQVYYCYYNSTTTTA